MHLFYSVLWVTILLSTSSWIFATYAHFTTFKDYSLIPPYIFPLWMWGGTIILNSIVVWQGAKYIDKRIAEGKRCL